MIKSNAGGERGAIGSFGEAGFPGLNRAEHNDPEGVKPRRGVEAWGRLGRAELQERQRAADADPDYSGVDRKVGRGVQKLNGSLGDLA